MENTDDAALAARVIRGHARRIADGDIEGLADLLRLTRELDAATQEAVVIRLARVRVLLGRHRRPARRHPPGRTAAVGKG